MKKKFKVKFKVKVLLALAMSLTMMFGMSTTAFSVTVARTNTNTTGVQLIGDTLVIQEDYHTFYIWGKSLMVLCPEVTDILPNNITGMMDIQFDGNLYQGIKEVQVVSSPEKRDKVHLEEGSMIITGVTTLKQVQDIKTAIAGQPGTLVELKAALTGTSKYLSATENYIVGKNNEVLNETGSRVAKKDIPGDVELIIDEEFVQVFDEEAKPSDSESKPVEEKKKDPDPTPTPAPTPTCQVDHSTLCPGQTCECGATGTGSHAWSWLDGKCRSCSAQCPECGGNGADGGCPTCGYEPDGPCSREMDHASVHLDQSCPQCPYVGTAPHNWEEKSYTGHKCSCGANEAHTWEDFGLYGAICTECGFECDHEGTQEDEVCPYCGRTQ